MALSTRSPLDGRELPPIAATAPQAVFGIVAKAKKAQRAWASTALGVRIRAIQTMKNRILDRAEQIARIVHEEVGKPEVEALLAEILPSADVADYWSSEIEELLDVTDVELDPISYPRKRGTILREPRGTIAVIMPWNFPVALPLRTIVPALLAGNAVVFKPSEVSPRSGKVIADLFEGVLPEGVLSVVQGAGDVGAALVRSPVDLVVFTGSVRTGRAVALACAERLVPCSLELGGKDAAIVLSDANLDRTANGILWGALTNAGQNCAAIERVYVEKSIAKDLISRIESLAKSLRMPDEVGPLSTEAQRAIVEAHVDAAREAGAKILTGGKRTAHGLGYEPTVVQVEREDLDLMREETFGPVVPIRVVDSVDQAIELANDSKYGLTASVWTRNIRRGKEIAAKLRAGVVTINNHAFTGALPAAPWSGFGDTGYGITSSPLALDALTRPRFVLVDRSRFAREMWWYPYTPALRTIVLSIATLRSATRSIVAKIAAVFRLLAAMPKRFAR
jgi:acyl-CoA reductase-like NAD-dependent aldehyde dehydrogenase